VCVRVCVRVCVCSNCYMVNMFSMGLTVRRFVLPPSSFQVIHKVLLK